MAPFAKPENALKRAEELINVGQKQAALQALHDIIASKRYRAWQKTTEKIMFKYVELCVEMRKGRFAKDGLIQYRIICQQVNVTSLEEVIKHFLHLSTEKAEQARNRAQALDEVLDVDDLEADKRPEDLMLSYVSGEKGKDRSDRELVTPWFKFLWETYRSVLEILRNNSKLEALYAMTAHRAFQFCKQYRRTTEFRRLCEIIRNHLANLNKYRDQRDRPDLTASATLQLYLDTRFEQLKGATELELWQEAFRSSEDIYGLMFMIKKTPKPSLMVIYYAKLTEIFWVSSSHLYHSYAWFKLFLLQKSFNKNLSQKDLQLISSSVVLAVLAILPYDCLLGVSHMELENVKERNLRMANLIGFNLDSKPENREMLSRSFLVSELISKGVLSCASQEVKDLYNLLEQEFLHQDLAVKAHELLSRLSKLGGKLPSAPSIPDVKLCQYIPALEKLATLRLLQQVSRLYKTIRIRSLEQKIPFFDFSTVEKISADAAKHGFLTIKVDHANGLVLSGDLGLESDRLQGHVASLAESLNKARAMIYTPIKKSSKLGGILPGLGEIVINEHKRLLARKTIIEQRKEEQENKLLELERKELERIQKLHQITNETEKSKHNAAEFELIKTRRILQQEREARELEEQALAEAQRKAGKKKGGKKSLFDGKGINLTPKERALNEQLRERHETERRYHKLGKTMDYLERAKREEASPLIEAAYLQRLVEEKALHEREQQQDIELSCQRHDGDLKEKKRLARLFDNKVIFQERVMKQREADLDRRRGEREERMNKIIGQRKEERELMRRKVYWVMLKEEEQKRLKEEEEARKQKEAMFEAQRKAKLDEIAKIQRQREREMEEKAERERQEAISKRSRPPFDPAIPPQHSPLTAAAAAAAPSGAAPAGASPQPSAGKYRPKFLRERDEGSGQAPPQPPSSLPDSGRWTNRGSSQQQQQQQQQQQPPGSRFGDRNVFGESWRGSSGRSGGSRPAW